MEIKIPCRNTVSGEVAEFDTLQEVANHLAAQENPGDWTGFEAFGQLPEPGEVQEPPKGNTKKVAKKA